MFCILCAHGAVDDEVDGAVEHDEVADNVIQNPVVGGHIILTTISVALQNVWNCGDLEEEWSISEVFC